MELSSCPASYPPQSWGSWPPWRQLALTRTGHLSERAALCVLRAWWFLKALNMDFYWKGVPAVPCLVWHVENQHAIKNGWRYPNRDKIFMKLTETEPNAILFSWEISKQWLWWTTIKRKEWENSKQWCSARSVFSFILFSWSTLLFHAATVHHLWCEVWPHSDVVGTHCPWEPPHHRDVLQICQNFLALVLRNEIFFQQPLQSKVYLIRKKDKRKRTMVRNSASSGIS